MGLQKNKIIAGGCPSTHLSSVFAIIEKPILPDIKSFLKTPKLIEVSARVTIAGNSTDFVFKLPNLPIHLNPNTEVVESGTWPHCVMYGLYVGKEGFVKASRFTFLPGLVDPELQPEALSAISNGFLDLFVHDDDIDDHTSGPNLSCLKPVNRRFVEIAEGAEVVALDQGKVKGYAEAISSFFSRHLTPNNREDFTRTLKDYLQSTEVEVMHIDSSKSALEEAPSYSDYLENRRDTSGIFHAVMMMWVAHDLNTTKLLRDYYPLKTLLKLVCDIVVRLNDVASCKKELNSFARFAGLSVVNSLEDAERVKPFITSNSVLLKFRGGMTLDQSISETTQEYNDVLKGFVKNSKLLECAISNDAELEKAIQVLFGWVIGHAVWAGLSKRYNLKILSYQGLS